ncbi:hypothetical protein RJ639_009799 [Escallonia herrerae]|uniref:Uncharacterized protein n=1 Tax=Escallonia herrerae TaxID=1293975 RepID=A0AA89ATF7_9ASTE|nr:hypothetical protein RJ639_009799 [Escallonia herrerae]
MNFKLLDLTATAGFMSGSSGIESVPGPELPQIDFLNRFNGISNKFWTSSAFEGRNGALEIVQQKG